MARIMRMPSEEELPPGPVRDFVDLLFRLYRMAHRPALRTISETIRRSDLNGTASTETIRRMLRGSTVPANWSTVEAVYLTLCSLADFNPSETVDFYGLQTSVQGHVTRLWHAALDQVPESHDQPMTLSAVTDDPWADDPPF